ncbi:MAG: enoyl-CoA hydratase [Nannocystaceae bacterium]|nr:enoyl-CoA hydratase [bacterium]
MSDAVLHEVSEGVLTVSFNRPDKKNALTLAMYDALLERLASADEDPSVRAIVVRGEGGSFTAGNDLSDFMKNPPASMDSPVGRVLGILPKLRTPLIAAVDGAAVGIGTTLLMHCDLVYCSDRSKFKMPFVPLGLCPEAGSSYLLPRMAGRVKATELLLLGKTFDGATALDIGLVNEVLPPDAVDARAAEVAREVAALPPASVRLTKALIGQASRDLLLEAMKREGDEFIGRLRSPEAAEAMQAFFQKRAPDFSKFE